MKNKSASLLHKIIVHMILIVLIFAFFFISAESKFGSRGVKQQVLEKELVLLIDSASAGMSFEVNKINLNGAVNSIEVDRGRVFVGVDGLQSVKGYPYFSEYKVSVDSDETKFVIRVE